MGSDGGEGFGARPKRQRKRPCRHDRTTAAIRTANAHSPMRVWLLLGTLVKGRGALLFLGRLVVELEGHETGAETEACLARPRRASAGGALGEHRPRPLARCMSIFFFSVALSAPPQPCRYDVDRSSETANVPSTV